MANVHHLLRLCGMGAHVTVHLPENTVCYVGCVNLPHASTYPIVKKNRNRHGGGVLLYVKDGIDYSEITELVSEQVESVWIKLMYKKETLMLGVVYRPPSSKNDYFNCVLDQIDHAHSLNENIILMGDLNYNYKFDESLGCNPLHQIEVLYNMRQLITSPTRVTLTTSTLIDVLFTNDHNSHVMTGA